MLPGRPPVRRLGATSLALSAGVLLVFAAPAPAAAAEPKKCVKGHDPESSIADIKCQFDNNVEAIKKKLDELAGKNKKDSANDKPKDKNTKDPKKPSKPPKPSKTPKPRKPPSTAPVVPQSSARTPSNFTVRPPSGSTTGTPRGSATDALPEQPQVAAPQSTPTLALPETRMVEPVAAAEPLEADSERAMWAAGGAATVTAVVMGQFSLIGSLRRRALQTRR